MAAHPDLQAEQEHLDRAYERLEAMRTAASELMRSVLDQGRGGTPQAREERDVIVRTSLHRLEQLDIGDEALCFGRIDRRPSGDQPEAFHIGRLAVSGPDLEPLVVDWRAPVAEPFYRATGRHPMGLRRRRHFQTEGRRLAGIEDELFAADGGPGDGDGSLVLAGSGALLAALERSRSGRMRDIVATVQREQDEVIRAPLSGVLVVQGGPGTGKTAVALHRAAYLLYTHRFPLERQGVLVVGPNPVFLRYIEHVLPSLGENGVTLTTVSGLVSSVEARGVETPVAAAVKGDGRMAKVLARAVRERQRPLRHDVAVPFGPFVLTFTADESARVIASARRRPGTHNSRRRYVEAEVLRHLRLRYDEAVERFHGAGLRQEREVPGVEPETEAADQRKELRRQPAVVEALDRLWPRLTAAELLHDLFGARPLIALAARSVLTPSEQAVLHRPRSRSLEAVPWTPADVALLDEARVLLGPRRSGAGPDEPRSYGHIVVDEAQDLSAMQLRMLARRSISGSMTVVGDIAQATGARAPSSWEEVIRHLPSRRPALVVELTVNYRTPAEIIELAGRVLRTAAPHLRMPRPARTTGEVPKIVPVEGGRVAEEVADRAGAEAEDRTGGTVAVISPASLVPDIGRALERAGVAYGEASRHGLESPVTLVAVELVKGLEFDAVIVVEPGRIVDEATQGLRALYVALSRATRKLTVIHSRALPAVLAGD